MPSLPDHAVFFAQQGNGTSKLFENDDRVITFDMHGAGNYPWKTKMKSNYDIGFPDGTKDEEYLAKLADWLPHLIELHDPSLIFFQAGVDALKEDSFGRLAMTRCLSSSVTCAKILDANLYVYFPLLLKWRAYVMVLFLSMSACFFRQGLLKRNNMVYSACMERNLPLVITMGGGYSRPIDGDYPFTYFLADFCILHHEAKQHCFVFLLISNSMVLITATCF